MFTPEYLNELVESSHIAATEFNMYLTNKVIDSVINLFERDGEIDIIPTNQHRIALLKQSGILVSDIEKEIRKQLPGVEKKIREAFLKAGYEINEDINKSIADMVESDKELKDFVGKTPRIENLEESEKKLLDAAYKRTSGEIRNLTRTTAADLNQQFLKSCDAAWWKATHGVDRNTAIREAITEVSKYGTHVIYKGGRKMTVEAAVRMCVLTGINQANAEITLTECANAGIRTVLVSSHIGARYTDKDEPANHQSWQGKIYSISDDLLKKMGYEEPKKNLWGKVKEFFQKFRKQKKYPDLVEVTGYGTITGLCGINCRHTMHMHYPGNSNTYKDYDNEENKQKYDLFQKQRAMERKIRETKKQMYDVRHAIKTLHDENAIAAMKEELTQIKALFDRQFDAYESFCKQNGLKVDQERLYVGNQKSGFSLEQNDRNNISANRYKNIEKSNNFVKIKEDLKSGALTSKNDPDFKKRDSFAEMYYREVLGRKREYEIRAVAKNSGFSTEEIDKVFSHVFEKEHLFDDGTIHKFFPDYDMAQSWIRLREGKRIQEHDIILLNHELMEANIMGKGTGIPYEAAHEEAQKQHNYAAALKKYLKENNLE